MILCPDACRHCKMLQDTHVLSPHRLSIINRLKLHLNILNNLFTKFNYMISSVRETSEKSCSWTSLEGILSNTVNNKYRSQAPWSKFLGSRFMTKETILESTKLEAFSNRGPQNEDSQRFSWNSWFSKYIDQWPKTLRMTWWPLIMDSFCTRYWIKTFV